MRLDNKLKLIFSFAVLLIALFALSALSLSSHFTGYPQADLLAYLIATGSEAASQIGLLAGSVLLFDVFVGNIRTEFPITIAWLLMGAIYIALKIDFIKPRGNDRPVEVTGSKYDRFDQTDKVNCFQSLRTALASNVGLGSIAGVALAISFGGAGAAFWMIVAGLIWMFIKFSESAFSRKYSETQSDERSTRGAIFYLSRGLAEKGLPRMGKMLAAIFALFSIGCALFGGCAFQVSQSLNVLKEMDPTLGAYPWVYGLMMTLFVAAAIIGNLRRIASAVNSIVPVMCVIYVSAALFILLSNFWMIPGAFKMILMQAFSAKALYGGIIGALITGCQRAAFSNQDTAISDAAGSVIKSDFSLREDKFAFLGPFIDRVTICAITVLVLVITGAYNDQASASMMAGSNGAALTSRMMGAHISWFPYLFSIAVLLFAYSSLISWASHAERCWMWLFGDHSPILFRMMFLMFALLGSILNSTLILNIAVLMILGMALPKIAGFAILTGYIKRGLQKFRVVKETKAFDRQKLMEFRRLPKAA